MLVGIYKQHLEEICEHARQNIVPHIREAMKVMDGTPKTWHNWGDRVIPVSERVGITFCVNRKKDPENSDRSYHYNANNVQYHLDGVRVVSVSPDWDITKTISVVPQIQDSWSCSYKAGHISALVGELRKIKDMTAFIQALERDALE